MVFRLSEALVDVLQGIDQKAQRMDIIGVSGVLRGILSLVVFCVTLVITQALAWAILAMGIATYAVVLLYDWPRAHQLTPFGGALDRKKILRLLGQCWPLMLNSIFLTSVVSIPRNNLEWICSATVLLSLIHI